MATRKQITAVAAALTGLIKQHEAGAFAAKTGIRTQHAGKAIRPAAFETMTHITESICWLILATCGSPSAAWANPYTQTATVIEASDTGWGNVHLQRTTYAPNRKRAQHVRYWRNVFAPLEPIDRHEWESVTEVGE